MRKTIFWVLLCCQIVSIAGLFYSCRHSGPAISLPAAKDLTHVTFEQGKNSGEYRDQEWISSFLAGLQQGKNTGTQSINDFPAASSPVKITLYFSGGGSSVLFLYEKNGRFYAEQPYTGIWKISEETYRKIF